MKNWCNIELHSGTKLMGWFYDAVMKAKKGGKVNTKAPQLAPAKLEYKELSSPPIIGVVMSVEQTAQYAAHVDAYEVSFYRHSILMITDKRCVFLD